MSKYTIEQKLEAINRYVLFIGEDEYGEHVKLQ